MPLTWKHMRGSVLFFLINAVAATALIFEGYSQGIFGAVSETPGFIRMADIGRDGVVTNSTKQGGLAAAYYFGAMWGCFVGRWVADKVGRKRGVFVGTIFGILGAALQAASRSPDMFLCARVVAGIGIGFMNAVILPWVSELSPSHNRGSSFSLVFVANYLGIVIAYWVNIGIRNSNADFRWRFPLAWMVVPLLVVDAALPFLPESPRWLIANGQRGQAIEILCKLRGDLSPVDAGITNEVERLDAIVEATHHQRNDLINVVLGGRYSGRLHLGRRAALGLALQWIQQWSGILAIVTWAGTLFTLAGSDSNKMLQLRTRACHSGRGQQQPHLSLYIRFFTMFNLIPCWIYGTEIWPQEIRAKGYSFTIFGWATGCGSTQFLIPIMLSRLTYGTYVFFGAINIAAVPVVWLLFPETANKSLEEVSLLFASDSLLATENTREFHRRVDAAGGHVATAVRRLLDEVDGRAGPGSGANAREHRENHEGEGEA
ncbi:major facilitator superfamily protein [Hirsutella rhossiliensis]|uniref:Sugar transporter domain-containing protein n=1 Tax=Hirsutella rhossiliensis TaxID=111463 RepID=A0A9P8ML52_9HYPO|nr:sugar transporter domain-containing protein [Hirsutella rhossiliensis]KAH0958303.1 sugar transporter domain-containing protein [Hirsutella rhossiliensis]